MRVEGGSFIMKNYKKKNVPSQQGIHLKKRIAATRGRAEFIGIVYLLAIIALVVAAAFVPVLQSEKAPLGVLTFWKVFAWSNLSALDTVGKIIEVANAALYGLMLLGLVINIFKALSKLDWLFKKKGSQLYNFNRNVFAMEDLGEIFSGSFASIIIFHFLIYLICGEMKVLWPSYVILGGGIFIHFFCGLIGGGASYFDKDARGNLIEKRRLIGLGAPFIRNLLQLIAVGGMIFFFVKASDLHTFIPHLLEKGGFQVYVLGNWIGFLSVGLQILTIIWIIVLLTHATNITEFSIEGTEAAGMKNFRIFSFFTFLTAGGTVVCKYLFGQATFAADANGYTIVEIVKSLDYNSLFIAVIALVMFIIELIMTNMPRIPDGMEQDEQTDYEDEDQPGPYSMYAMEGVPPFLPPMMAGFEDNSAWGENVAEINCPICSKRLRIHTAAEYHRCPSCGKVFETRVKQS